MPFALGGSIKRNRYRWTAMAVVAVVVVIEILAARPVLNMMLERSVSGEAEIWAEHVLGMVGTQAFRSNTQEDRLNRAHIAGAIGGAFQTSATAQIDLIRPDQNWAVSIGRGLEHLSDSEAGTRSIEDALELFFTADADTNGIDIFGRIAVPLAYSELGRLKKGITQIGHGVKSRTYYTATFNRRVGGRHLIAVRIIKRLDDLASVHKLILGAASALMTSVTAIIATFAAMATSRSREAETLSRDRARYLAEHDPLTGLLNRHGFQFRADDFLTVLSDSDKTATLVLCDTDHMKEINDLHGYETGDAVIVAMADKVRSAFPDAALTARLDGDEFAVLLVGHQNEAVRDTWNTTTEVPIDLGRNLSVSTSVGLAAFPENGDTLVDLMRSADLALEAVKHTEARGVGTFHEDMSDAFERRAWEIDGIRDALKAGTIEPFYQPLMNAMTGELEGFEALARWNHPELGILPPGRFESALEDPATARGVTRCMLHRVVEDLDRWHREGKAFSVGLNVGEADLRDAGFLDMLDRALAGRAFPNRALAIEVTEKAVNTDTLAEVLPVLNAIRERGMFVGLDDFGTGTSSITLLRQIPCTAIKIDKSFVDNMARDRDDFTIVRSLTNLGHDLSKVIIAEGVEDLEQADMLRDLGVDLLQGYRFSKPLAVAEVEERLKTWTIAAVRRADGEDALRNHPFQPPASGGLVPGH